MSHWGRFCLRHRFQNGYWNCYKIIVMGEILWKIGCKNLKINKKKHMKKQ